MAPFVEGERTLTEGKMYHIKEAEGAGVIQKLFVVPWSDRLFLRIVETVKGTKKRPSVKNLVQIVLDPKEPIQIGERRVEWKEE